jgi:uncharacterized membrane protein
MKSRLLSLAEELRQSYWFLPSLMTLGAALLAAGMIWLDGFEGSAWMDGVPWLYASRPSGARQVLSAIGGSMITVAGTVFSVTIAAVVYASGQYGPRLLSNFMRDRGNQVTLGTFIATFLYCLIVLRTIRSPEEPGGGGVGFVPNLALLVAVLLAVCSVAVLIFFIHHVPSKIHINSVIDDIGTRLLREVQQRFPTFVGAERPEHSVVDAPLPDPFRDDADPGEAAARVPVRAKATGYIQVIDEKMLLRTASERNLVCRLQYRPGDFIHAGRALAELWPRSRVDEAAERRIGESFSIGSQRTALQDLRFLIDELVEIAARALSPGMNDPFTAVTCLDWLGATLSELCLRELPSPLRREEAGAVRIIAYPQTFRYFMDRSFGALAQYCASDMVAALRYLEALGEVAVGCDQAHHIKTIDETVVAFEALAIRALAGLNEERVAKRAAELRRALADPDYKRRLRDSKAWLGGTA